MKTACVILVAGLAGACGGSPVLSCDSLIACVETSGPFDDAARQQAKSICMQQRGTYSDGPCNLHGVVGGCQAKYGPVSNTTWFRMSPITMTVADVKTQCTQLRAVFVAP